MLNRKILAERLKKLLKESNTSQQELATVLHVKRPTVTQYCSESKQPTINHFILIADYFDVSMDYLAGRVDNGR